MFWRAVRALLKLDVEESSTEPASRLSISPRCLFALCSAQNAVRLYDDGSKVQSTYTHLWLDKPINNWNYRALRHDALCSSLWNEKLGRQQQSLVIVEGTFNGGKKILQQTSTVPYSAMNAGTRSLVEGAFSCNAAVCSTLAVQHCSRWCFCRCHTCH